MADFATVAELEAFMGTTSLGSRGTAMLGYASALIRRETGQDLELTTGRIEEFAGHPYRRTIVVSEVPVIAITSVTIAAVAFTAFRWDRWTGSLWRTDGAAWSEGPVIVTYDSGYGPASDEIIGVKMLTLEIARRALAPDAPGFSSYGDEVAPVAGKPEIYITPDERGELAGFRRLVMA